MLEDIQIQGSGGILWCSSSISTQWVVGGWGVWDPSSNFMMFKAQQEWIFGTEVGVPVL
jgi:hypothetical protein